MTCIQSPRSCTTVVEGKRRQEGLEQLDNIKDWAWLFLLMNFSNQIRMTQIKSGWSVDLKELLKDLLIKALVMDDD